VILDMKMRLLLYGFSMIAYSLFMASHAPGGFGWHDYHAYRIFNAVAYLKLNGYFANYGFSIWSDCPDCDLTLYHWDDKIYLSQPTLFQLWPYIALNSVVGTTAFFSLGPIIDKLVVFITGRNFLLCSHTELRKINAPTLSVVLSVAPCQLGGLVSWYSASMLRQSGLIRCNVQCGMKSGFFFFSVFRF
jgi:hypothetical protein